MRCILGLLAATAALAPPAPAAAACAIDVRPDHAPLGEDAPLDASFWSRHGMPRVFHVGGYRTRVAGSESVIEGEGSGVIYSVFTPAEPLERGGSYVILDDEDEWWVRAGYTRLPPGPPALTVAASRETVDAGVRLDVRTDGFLAVLDLGGASLTGTSGTVTDVLRPAWVFAGYDACLGRNVPPERDACGPTTARVGAFDLAGRFSGWSEPREISLPPALCETPSGPGEAIRPYASGAPVGGCSCSGGGAAALLVLVGPRRRTVRRSWTSSPA